MLGDLIPGGQYATYEIIGLSLLSSKDPLSIFNEDSDPDYPNLLPGAKNWRSPSLGDYENALGDVAKIQVANGIPANTASVVDGEIYPQQLLYASDFVKFFQPYWANALLGYHPESSFKTSFCDPQTLYNNNANLLSSEEYDFMMTFANTYTEATSLQYESLPATPLNLMNYTGGTFPILENDPFFSNNATLKTDMQSRLSSINGGGKNLYNYVIWLEECGRWYGSDISSCTPTSFSTYISNASTEKKEFYLAKYKRYLFIC